MFVYEARFSDNTVTRRRSSRVYTHAYQLTPTQSGYRTVGFALSLERAQRASRGDNRRYYEGKAVIEIVEVRTV